MSDRFEDRPRGRRDDDENKPEQAKKQGGKPVELVGESSEKTSGSWDVLGGSYHDPQRSGLASIDEIVTGKGPEVGVDIPPDRRHQEPTPGTVNAAVSQQSRGRRASDREQARLSVRSQEQEQDADVLLNESGYVGPYAELEDVIGEDVGLTEETALAEIELEEQVLPGTIEEEAPYFGEDAVVGYDAVDEIEMRSDEPFEDDTDAFMESWDIYEDDLDNFIEDLDDTLDSGLLPGYGMGEPVSRKQTPPEPRGPASGP